MKKILNLLLLLFLLSATSCSYWRFHYRKQHPITFPGTGMMQEDAAKNQKSSSEHSEFNTKRSR